jgi:hypothetical protein
MPFAVFAILTVLAALAVVTAIYFFVRRWL